MFCNGCVAPLPWYLELIPSMIGALFFLTFSGILFRLAIIIAKGDKD